MSTVVVGENGTETTEKSSSCKCIFCSIVGFVFVLLVVVVVLFLTNEDAKELMLELGGWEEANCTQTDCGLGATCSANQFPGVGYTCTCDEAYSGDSTNNEPALCVDADHCEGVDCGTGGICTDAVAPETGYSCHCDTGWIGSVEVNAAAVCSDEDECDGVDCGAFSTCTDHTAPETGFTCSCMSGYTGDSVYNGVATCTAMAAAVTADAIRGSFSVATALLVLAAIFA